MAIVKRIVCLANSRKLSGRCVAGIEIVNNQRRDWIRPVSSRENQEVSEYERNYEDGSDPAILDVVDIPLLRAQPQTYQQENWLLDPDRYWIKIGGVSENQLNQLVDRAQDLWVNGYHTRQGKNDQVPLTQANNLRSSLRLLKVNAMNFAVFSPGASYGNPKRRVQGQFWHHGVEYCLWVTDPVWEQSLLQKPDGRYRLGESFVTVSLGEPFKDACYKLIAGIIKTP